MRDSYQQATMANIDGQIFYADQFNDFLAALSLHRESSFVFIAYSKNFFAWLAEIFQCNFFHLTCES